MLSCSCRVQAANIGLQVTALQPRKQQHHAQSSTTSHRELVKAAASASPAPAPSPGPGAGWLPCVPQASTAVSSEPANKKTGPQPHLFADDKTAPKPSLFAGGIDSPQLLQPTPPSAGGVVPVLWPNSTTPTHGKQQLLAKPTRRPPVDSVKETVPETAQGGQTGSAAVRHVPPQQLGHLPLRVADPHQPLHTTGPQQAEWAADAGQATDCHQPEEAAHSPQTASPGQPVQAAPLQGQLGAIGADQPTQGTNDTQPLRAGPSLQQAMAAGPGHVAPPSQLIRPVHPAQKTLPETMKLPSAGDSVTQAQNQPNATQEDNYVYGRQQISWQASQYMARIRQAAATRQLPQAMAEELLVLSESGPDPQRLASALRQLSLPGHAIALAICARWEKPLQRAQLKDGVLQAWGQVLLPLVLQASPHDVLHPNQSTGQSGARTHDILQHTQPTRHRGPDSKEQPVDEPTQPGGHVKGHVSTADTVTGSTGGSTAGVGADSTANSTARSAAGAAGGSAVHGSMPEVMHKRDIAMLAAIISITASMGQLNKHCGLLPMAAITLYLQHHLSVLSPAQLVGVVGALADMQYYPYTAPAERLAATYNNPVPAVAASPAPVATSQAALQVASPFTTRRSLPASRTHTLQAQQHQMPHKIGLAQADLAGAQKQQRGSRHAAASTPLLKLRPAPCHWMQSVLTLATERLDEFTGPQICKLIKSIAVLDMHAWSSSGSYAHVTKKFTEAVAARDDWAKDLVELIPHPHRVLARPATRAAQPQPSSGSIDASTATHVQPSSSRTGTETAIELQPSAGDVDSATGVQATAAAVTAGVASISGDLCAQGARTNSGQLQMSSMPQQAGLQVSADEHPAADMGDNGDVLKLYQPYTIEQVQVALWTLHHFSPRLLQLWMRVLVESSALCANDLNTLGLHAVFQAMAEYKIQATPAAQARLWAAVQRRWSDFSINRLRQLLWWAQQCGIQPPSHLLRAALHRAANLSLLRMYKAGLPITSRPAVDPPTGFQKTAAAAVHGLPAISQAGSTAQHSNQAALQFASNTVLLIRRRRKFSPSHDFNQAQAGLPSSGHIATADYVKPLHVVQLLVLAARARLRLPRKQAAPLAWLLASGLHLLTPHTAAQGLAALAVCAPYLARPAGAQLSQPTSRYSNTPAGFGSSVDAKDEQQGGDVHSAGTAHQAASAALHTAFEQYVKVVLKVGSSAACASALLSGLGLGLHPSPHTLRQLLWHAYHGGSNSVGSSRHQLSAKTATRLVCALAKASTVAVVLCATWNSGTATGPHNTAAYQLGVEGQQLEAGEQHQVGGGEQQVGGGEELGVVGQQLGAGGHQLGAGEQEDSQGWECLKPNSSVREVHAGETNLIMELVPGLMLRVESTEPSALQHDPYDPPLAHLVEYLWAVSKLGLLQRVEYSWWCQACSLLNMDDTALQRLKPCMLVQLLRLSTARPPSVAPQHLHALAGVSNSKQTAHEAPSTTATQSGTAAAPTRLPDTNRLLAVMFHPKSDVADWALDAEQLTELVWAAGQTRFKLSTKHLQQLSGIAAASMAQLRLAQLPRLVLGLALCFAHVTKGKHQEARGLKRSSTQRKTGTQMSGMRPSGLLEAIANVPVDAFQRAASARHPWGLSYKLRQYLAARSAQRRVVQQHASMAGQHRPAQQHTNAHNQPSGAQQHTDTATLQNCAQQHASTASQGNHAQQHASTPRQSRTIQQHVTELVCALTPDQLATLLLGLVHWEVELPDDWLDAYLHMLQARGHGVLSFLGVRQCVEALVMLQHWPGKPFYNYLCKQLKYIRLRGYLADTDDLHIRQLMHQLCRYGQLQMQWRERPVAQPVTAAAAAEQEAAGAELEEAATAADTRVVRIEATSAAPARTVAAKGANSNSVQGFPRLLRRICLQHLNAALSMLLASRAAVSGLLPAATGAMMPSSRLWSPMPANAMRMPANASECHANASECHANASECQRMPCSSGAPCSR